MLDPLAFKVVSLLLLGILALTGLILAGISVKKEDISDKPLRGVFPVVLLLAALCAFVSLLTAYVHFQKPASTQLKSKIAALTFKEAQTVRK
jgi:O-antigen/teichoic acid export membrane protein